jgi:hypothetical protein
MTGPWEKYVYGCVKGTISGDFNFWFFTKHHPLGPCFTALIVFTYTYISIYMIINSPKYAN